MRNVFALTSVFERCGAEVLYAENGREGIEALERNEDVRLVLMDIMMPELDGYATTEAIRNMPQFADLPIIAVTAKAMKGDREKAIASGATDYITKPVDTGHLLAVMRNCLERAAARCTAEGDPEVTNKARILLVDDRSENLVALEAILSSLNQVLVPVRSGEEALKALLVDEFAVILLDVVMPGMDGFETAAHIKRRPKTRDVPIIFLTAASAEPDHAFRGYAAGAVDYISKPFDPWVLRAKVSVFVELYVKNRQLREQAELLRSQLDRGRALDRGTARRAIPAPGSVPESGDPAATAATAGELRARGSGPAGRRRAGHGRRSAAAAGTVGPPGGGGGSGGRAVVAARGQLGPHARRLRQPARTPGGAAPGRPRRAPRRLAARARSAAPAAARPAAPDRPASPARASQRPRIGQRPRPGSASGSGHRRRLAWAATRRPRRRHE